IGRIGDEFGVAHRGNRVVLTDGGDDGRGSQGTHRGEFDGLEDRGGQRQGDAVEFEQRPRINGGRSHEAVALVLFEQARGRRPGRAPAIDLQQQRLQVRRGEPFRQYLQEVGRVSLTQDAIQYGRRHFVLYTSAQCGC